MTRTDLHAEAAEAYLIATYTKTTPVSVEDVGPSDLLGNARCRLSNGQFAVLRLPVRGDVVGHISHKPTITRSRDSDGWSVVPKGAELFWVRHDEILRMMGKR